MRDPTSVGDPRGLDRLDRSGIPEGSIDSIDSNRSIGAPLVVIPQGLIESTRSIGDPRGLDRLESIDRGSLRGDPLGRNRIDSIDRGSLRGIP